MAARDNYRHNNHRLQYHPPQNLRHSQQKHLPLKRRDGDYDDYDLQLRQKPEDDYYEQYNDEDDEDGEDDEDDIDGFVDDTDNNLSDRSYARITRSKLDVSIANYS